MKTDDDQCYFFCIQCNTSFGGMVPNYCGNCGGKIQKMKAEDFLAEIKAYNVGMGGGVRNDEKL